MKSNATAWWRMLTTSIQTTTSGGQISSVCLPARSAANRQRSEAERTCSESIALIPVYILPGSRRDRTRPWDVDSPRFREEDRGGDHRADPDGGRAFGRVA